MEKINQNKAKCKYCSVDFACAGGNTSGLMRHVRSKHPTVLLASPETKTSQPKMPMFSARPELYVCRVLRYVMRMLC